MLQLSQIWSYFKNRMHNKEFYYNFEERNFIREQEEILTRFAGLKSKI